MTKKFTTLGLRPMRSLIHPFYISGFTQADGCFHVAIDRNKSYKLGVRVTPKFILTQHIDAFPFFEQIQAYFDVGHLVKNRNEGSTSLIVNSLPQLKEVIIPHFDKYPLRSGKLESFLKFKQVIEMMVRKNHLQVEGLAKIIEISYGVNSVTQRILDRKLDLFKLIGFNQEEASGLELPIIPTESSINPNFVTGLVDGDGSFFISFKANKRVVPSFTVIQDTASKAVLTELTNFFNCGAVYDLKSAASRFQVESLDSIITHILPHFIEYTLCTSKKEHFRIFSEVCRLLKEGSHKTDEGFNHIVELAYEMNKNGRGRRLTKEQFMDTIMNKATKDKSSSEES